jgi:hypothetical protein
MFATSMLPHTNEASQMRHALRMQNVNAIETEGTWWHERITVSCWILPFAETSLLSEKATQPIIFQ